MTYPYGLISDLHLHRWSSFSTTLPSGINSRLQTSLDEIVRCANEVENAGSNLLICAGDTFHVRGSISPEVLNPTMDVFQGLINKGFRIVIIPGNHDLASKDSNRLSSAVTALEGIGCIVAHETVTHHDITLIPWMDSVASLKAEIEGLKGNDLIIHAPVDGVIMGIPDHGLSADWLGKQNFKRVFSGHFHNHKDFGNGVYSIGALTHNSWSDVGSKAGFLIVHEGRVERFASHAPEFVEIDSDTKEEDVPLIVDGNFVRCKVSTTKVKEINELKEWLYKCGAKGVVINSVKQPTKARTGTVAHSVNAGASLEVSLSEFIKANSFDNKEKLQIECQKILAEAEV